MLFTTTTFVGLFLPIVLIGYFLLGHRSERLAAGWLFAASVFFYGYWMPVFTLLLLASILVNFGIGGRIAGSLQSRRTMGRWRTCTVWMTLGIVFNLVLLGYFKYANFFVDNLDALLGLDWHVGRIILPIGISFYTFTQIAFLVDTWYGKVNEFRAIHYGLFVTYFPHLVAGPVLHHAQMMPQFANRAVYRFDTGNFFAGVVVFCIGLFKKVVLADGIAPYADAVFVPADAGAQPSVHEAWLGALAYTFQLYFDFSGYSDMAVGLSWMFNIRLPFNFDSPYKSTSITEFWRRWHITLSNFLRDYLYIALGGNRKGPVRRYLNLGVTMVLGGLWHGASWSFVFWGALHGVYLMINHAFKAFCDRRPWGPELQRHRLFGVVSWAITMLAVIVAWVYFRAETHAGATRVVQSLFGMAGAHEGLDRLLWNAGLKLEVGALWCAVLGAIAFVFPNSNLVCRTVLAWFARSRDAAVALGSAATAMVLLLVLVNAGRESVSAFIYFNF